MRMMIFLLRGRYMESIRNKNFRGTDRVRCWLMEVKPVTLY